MKMTTTVTDPNAELPDHPDGEMWPLVMLWNRDQQTCADTATELLDELFASDGHPGYAKLDDVDAFAARLDHATRFADFLQATELDAFARNDPDAATAIMSDDILLTVVSRDKNRVLEEFLFGPQGWSGEKVPNLIVVKQYYDESEPLVTLPHGDKVMVLDAEREMDYLRSLAQAGLIELMEAA